MPKFRKKPVVIEAEVFLGDAVEGVYHDDEGDVVFDGGRRRYWVDTLEGRHRVTLGDWIITGVKGEKYPCKPDIFEMTYERVED